MQAPPEALLGRITNSPFATWRLLAPAGVLVALVLGAYFAPLPHNPYLPDASAAFLPPGTVYWFGTDQDGMDVFSRTIVAARLDVPLAIVGALVAAVVGVPLGLWTSSRARAAEFFMRFIDLFQSFPLLVLAISLVALGSHRLTNIVLAIAIVNVPQFIRLVRAEGMVVRSRRFVEAARAFGASPLRVAFRHVLPNVTGVIFAQLSLSTGVAILAIAALSFLGVGIVPPTASWGAIVNRGAQYIVTGRWWIALFPSLAVLVVVLSFNTLADAFYRMSNPLARGRR